MPVRLGAPPQADFSQPLGLLSDCHRRIEHFLGVLVRVAARSAGGPLDEEHRAAIRTCLDYFDHAAPQHTADEEQSLFPRLRSLAKTHPRVNAAMRQLDSLEADHAAADDAHAEARQWLNRWLSVGTLAPQQLQRLRAVLGLLQGLYRRHIMIEDDEVFRLAGEVLDQPSLRQIGREMAARRGLESRDPPAANAAW